MNQAHTSPGKASTLSPLKQALLALERAQARIHELEEKRSAPIAVVGVGCRIPGGEDGVDGYWRLLYEKRSAVSDGVEFRLADSLRGKTLPKAARYAALLKHVDLFDPRHFGISPREAIGMDPQQRLLLEVSWEALENAGIDPSDLYQSATGVYVGLSSHDYAQLQLRDGEARAIDPHFASGVAASVAAGRISYVLGLNGPSLSIDTACSSSLVAVHLACEALRRGECSMAMAGGVNLILSHEPSVAFAQAGMLSERGVCRAFDAGADGFVRGEGCGVVVLKPLAEAERNGDRILAVILGSAVNQDGASSGLTVPNGLAQQGLLREAHRRAGIEARQVGYVETHGTGTALGDPIEAEALGVVFGEGRPRERDLLIGSVKTNVGHLEAAAGVAGLIKLVLGLQQNVIPGQLNCERPSDHVRWSELPLKVVTEAREWEPIDERRIAGVSSFGFSGTNAHVVVEGWQEAPTEEAAPYEDVLVLTARTEEALRELAERYETFLSQSSAGWNDVCHTAAVGRADFGERLAVIAEKKPEAVKKLRGWLEANSTDGVYRGQVGARHYSEIGVLGATAAIAAAFVRGAAIDWPKRMGERDLRKVALPTYPFQRERYWIASRELPDVISGVATDRPMLGRRMRSAGVRGQYEANLSATSWIGEHGVEGQVVLPATGHLELMLEAASEALGHGSALEDVVLEAPLAIEGARRAQTVVEEETNGRNRVRLYAEQGDGEWKRVSEGWLSPQRGELPERLDLPEIRNRLRHLKAGSAFYTQLASRGLTFGDRFHGVQNVWTGPGEALGEIAVTETDGADWVLTPWWLDACLQVADTTASGPDEDDTQLYLPLSIDRIEVFGSPAKQSWSHVVTRRVDADTLIAEVTVIDADGVPLVQIAGLRFRNIARKAEDVSSWMYRLDWQKVQATSDRQEDAIHQAEVELEARIEQLRGNDSIVEYNNFFAELEELSAAYVLEAFCQLGWPEAGSLLSAEILQRRWRIVPQHQRLLHRLLEIAVETGRLQREADGFRFGVAPAKTAANQSAELVQRFPFGRIELNLVSRCGAALSEVLTGQADSRELVFPRGQSEEMAGLYRDSVPARIYNQMLADTVARIVRVRGGAATRILEVGGGTGATTQYVLEALGAAGEAPAEYLFTDISPLLVRRAQKHFADTGFLRTQVFDLERDGNEQRINDQFSIVIAVNVLHATADLSATLARLKTLLAPDGVLVLVEVTGKQRWADITVGLLDGWWSFADLQLRPDYPSLQSGEWSQLLEEAGFEQIVALPRSPDQQSIFGRQELIFANNPAHSKHILMVGEGELSQKITSELWKRGASIEPVHADNLTDRLMASSKVDAVLWVADRQNSLGYASVGTPSGASQNPISSLLTTTQALLKIQAKTSPRLYIITAGASSIDSSEAETNVAATPLVGFATGIATEAPHLRCTRLDCSREESDTDAACVVAEVLSDADQRWVAWREGTRYLARLQRFQASSIREEIPERVQLQAGSGIEALHYVPATAPDLKPDEVEITVLTTAVNFRDVLQSVGVLPFGQPLGTDCAGVVLRTGEAVTDLAPGDGVIAIAPGCIASHAITARALLVRKPKTLSFAEAAAQAVAYLTADYALNEVARVARGERVLIHAAAGGVGLAAVHLCRIAGAEPIVTAGNERKRAFLKDMGIEQVYDSRSLDFAVQISGKVDIVVNSLTGDAINAGLGLLKPDGRFIELGKTDLRQTASIEQEWPGVRYLRIDLTPLFAARSRWVSERLVSLFSEIEKGSLPVLPITTFDFAEVKDAFRYMARAEHIGRVVVERRNSDSFTGAHLITGGMRGIGLKLAEWLAENGARKLVLVGRRLPDEVARQAIARIEANGVVVRTLPGDIANPAVAQAAVEMAGSNLRGVWHSAGLLENASLEEQSWPRIQRVLSPKVDGAWNLHLLTRNLPLESFVLFSSWASIGGSHGQSNHCAANAFLDGLARLRRAHGLPALSVNWGAWGQTGAAAGDEVQRRLMRSGMDSMSPDGALRALRLALRGTEPQVAIAAINWPRYLTQNSGDRSLYVDFLQYLDLAPRDPAQNVQVAKRSQPERIASGSSPSSLSFETILALPATMREAALVRVVGDIVRKTLGLHPEEKIDPDVPLNDLGMDSLLAIELRNSLSVVLLRQFPSTILFDYPTLRSLGGYLEKEVFPHDKTIVSAAETRAEESASVEKESSLGILDMIEHMSDEEVEARFDWESRV
jgi:3-oxoacyl-(acyl-carrier-protein) synthase/NADPH:quinone reductase-like Zn-dependent oxidoreductase/SAM-dependent methyltransferase/NAD(P)-dependent dehydrogenase (short-subunit alcohol dehydrogenase family)